MSCGLLTVVGQSVTLPLPTVGLVSETGKVRWCGMRVREWFEDCVWAGMWSVGVVVLIVLVAS
jgi:hypothetical protein